MEWEASFPIKLFVQIIKANRLTMIMTSNNCTITIKNPSTACNTFRILTPFFECNDSTKENL